MCVRVSARHNATVLPFFLRDSLAGGCGERLHEHVVDALLGTDCSSNRRSQQQQQRVARCHVLVHSSNAHKHRSQWKLTERFVELGRVLLVDLRLLFRRGAGRRCKLAVSLLCVHCRSCEAMRVLQVISKILSVLRCVVALVRHVIHSLEITKKRRAEARRCDEQEGSYGAKEEDYSWLKCKTSLSARESS